MEWTVVTFTKMDKWKPDVVVKVQEFSLGHIQFAKSGCHRIGKASSQVVKVPQELQQTN